MKKIKIGNFLCCLGMLIFVFVIFTSSACKNTKSNGAKTDTNATNTTTNNAANSTATKEATPNKPHKPSREQVGELRKLSNEEVIKKATEGTLFSLYVVYRNQKREKLNSEEKSLLNKDKLGKDYYADEEGTVREIRVRPVTHEDRLIEVQVRELHTNTWKKFPTIDVDCSNEGLSKLITEAGNIDRQRNETGRRFEVDSTTAVMMTSMMKKCGFPSIQQVNRQQINTIWLIFQHIDPALRVMYYPQLVKAAEDGHLEWSKIALMEDRMFVGQQMDQAYGSQAAAGELWPIHSPKDVDKMRKEKGMGTIKEHMEKVGLDYDPAMFK